MPLFPTMIFWPGSMELAMVASIPACPVPETSRVLPRSVWSRYLRPDEASSSLDVCKTNKAASGFWVQMTAVRGGTCKAGALSRRQVELVVVMQAPLSSWCQASNQWRAAPLQLCFGRNMTARWDPAMLHNSPK